MCAVQKSMSRERWLLAKSCTRSHDMGPYQ